MFTGKHLIYTYKEDNGTGDYLGGEYFECDEAFLRNSIKEAVELMELETSLEKEIYNAYSTLLKFGHYDLPNIRFELLSQNEFN